MHMRFYVISCLWLSILTIGSNSEAAGQRSKDVKVRLEKCSDKNFYLRHCDPQQKNVSQEHNACFIDASMAIGIGKAKYVESKASFDKIASSGNAEEIQNGNKAQTIIDNDAKIKQLDGILQAANKCRDSLKATNKFFASDYNNRKTTSCDSPKGTQNIESIHLETQDELISLLKGHNSLKRSEPEGSKYRFIDAASKGSPGDSRDGVLTGTVMAKSKGLEEDCSNLSESASRITEWYQASNAKLKDGAAPGAPGTAAAPGTPAAPGTAAAPGTPAAPGTAAAPGTPAAPGTAAAPGTPAAPGTAAAPGTPAAPGTAAAPGTPAAPATTPAPRANPAAVATTALTAGETSLATTVAAEQRRPATAPDPKDPKPAATASAAEQKSWLSRNKWYVIGAAGVAAVGGTVIAMNSNKSKKKKRQAEQEARTRFFEACIKEKSKTQTVVDPVKDCKDFKPSS